MWQPVRSPGGLTGRIVAQVEKLINDESLKPGDQLPPEREMATLIQVSRPSLREAVRVLEAQGRLVVRHGQGVFVRTAMTEQELRSALAATEVSYDELFAMREVLEVPAAAWAAEKASRRELASLRAALDEMGALIDEAPRDDDGEPEIDFERLASLDAGFHLGIAVAAGNKFLRQTAGVLHDMLLAGMETTLTIPGRVELSRRDHERIYAALAAREPTAARSAARAHIRAAHAAANRRVNRATGPRSASVG